MDLLLLHASREWSPVGPEMTSGISKMGLAAYPILSKAATSSHSFAGLHVQGWCYTELFVWLCKLAQVQFTQNDPRTKLFRSVQTRHIIKTTGGADTEVTNHHYPGPLIANLKFRGYDGDTDALVSLYRPLARYSGDIADSTNYHIAGGSPSFDSEYLAHLVNFLLQSWLLFRDKGCTQPRDKELCIRILMEALKRYW